jgi:hypothetical protein
MHWASLTQNDKVTQAMKLCNSGLEQMGYTEMVKLVEIMR